MKPAIKTQAAPPVAGHARPAGRASAILEAEAVDAAARVARGETGIARRLSRVPASSVDLGGGEPLPLWLRPRLERAFGADLGLIRVHHGRKAAARAGAARAAGLAAGRDIVFGVGRYAPSTTPGLELLAHEIAHALQQTGEETGTGHRVTRQTGTAAPQLSFDPTQMVPEGVFEDTPAWDDLTQRYRTAFPNDSLVEAAIIQISAVIGGSLDWAKLASEEAERRRAALIALTREPGFDVKPAPIAALHVDVLKAVEAFDRAGEIVIARGHTLRTCFRSARFYSAFRSPRAAWIAPFVRGSSLLKPLYPSAYLETIRIFLYGPTREIQNLHPEGRFPQIVDDAVKAALAESGFVQNELFFVAVETLKYLDALRQLALRAAEDKVGPKAGREAGLDSPTLARARLVIADAMSEHGLGLPASVGEEVVALGELAEPGIRRLGREARGYWDRVFVLPTTGVEGEASLTSVVAAIKANPRFRELGREVTAMARAFLSQPGSGRPLAPAAYQTRVNQALLALRKISSAHELALIDLSRRGKLDGDEPLQLGLVLRILSEVDFDLRSYREDEDRRLVDKYRLADARIYHRLQVSRRLRDVAAWFDWNDLRQTADSVLTARTQIAMPGDWKIETDLPIGTLTRDLEGTSMPRELSRIGLTVSHLDNFLWALRSRALAQRLRTLLAQRGQIFTDQGKPILEEAEHDVGQFAPARRYRMPKSDVVYLPPGTPAAGAEPPPTLAQQLLEHPRVSQDILAKLLPTERVLVPEDPAMHRRAGVVVWVIPRLDALTALLQGVPGLDALVREAARHQTGEEKLDPDDWFGWLQLLNSIATQELGGRTLKEITLDALQAEMTGARVELEQQERLASSHERRREGDRLRAQLGAYDRYNIDHYTRPNEILAELEVFAGFVAPKQDQAFQLGALLLEIAPGLSDAIGPKSNRLIDDPVTRRWDLIAGFYPSLSGALRLWEDTALRAELLSLRRADMDETAYVAAAQTLRTLVLALRGEVERRVRETGLRAEVSGQAVTVLEANLRVTPESSAFLIEGHYYRLRAVHQSFLFHRAFGLKPSPVHWPGEDPTGRSLLLDPSGREMARSGAKLLTIAKDGVDTEVSDRDEELLAEFENAVALEDVRKQLEKLGETLEVVADVMLDVLELIPGAGQAVMAGRVVTGIMAFLVSDDFDQIRSAVGQKGFGAITDALDQVKLVLQPEDLLTWLLFHEAQFHFDVAPKVQPTQRPLTSRGPLAKMAALLRNIFELGRRILGSVERLRAVVQLPAREAQNFVLTHPGAALITRFIVNNFDRLSAARLEDLGADIEGVMEGDWRQVVGKHVNEGAQGLADRGRDLVDQLRHLELPEEIIAQEVVIDLVIDLVVSRLGAKYRKGVQAVRWALQRLNLWSKILAAVSDALKSQNIDINKVYQDTVRSALEPHLEAVRDSFIKELFGLLRSVPFLDKLEQPKGTPVALDLAGLGFPDAQPYPAGSLILPVQWPAALPSRASGHPLSHPRLTSLERSFGHDFRHVRLHRGADADVFTGAAGADALTSGSHIFLNSRVGLASQDGNRILHHELAHVLQQAGPRPLHRVHPATPTWGGTGRGVRWDPAAESEARDVSRLVEPARSRILTPVRVGHAPGLALSPAFGPAFFHRFMDELLLDRTLRKQMDEIDKLKAGGAQRRLSGDTLNQELARTLPDQLFDAIVATPASRFTRPFGTVSTEILNYVRGKRDEIKNAVVVIIERVRQPLPLTRAQRQMETPPPPVQYASPNRLKLDLEDYLFARTGVAIKQSLRETKGGEMVRGRTVIDPQKSVKQVDYGYLHLPFLGGTATLWDLVIANTFVRQPTIRTKYGASSRPQDYKYMTRLVLGRLGPRPDVYDRSTFKLGNPVAGAVEAEVYGAKDLQAEQFPSPSDYSATSVPTGADPAQQNIGLRLGNYDTWGPNGGRKSPEREAHHITQYLLLEYLRNRKLDRPFPLGVIRNLYPGVTGSGLVDTITDAGKEIRVAEHEERRGGLMPTILLSRHAHQSGIHIYAQPDDDPAHMSSNPITTPGGAVHDAFRSALGDVAEIMKDRPSLDALQKSGDAPTMVKGGKQLSRPELQHRIFQASVKTYHWMRGEMQPKLRRALTVQEIEYYATTAERLGKKSELQAGRMSAVFVEAVAWDKKGMEQAGFRL
jgi:hypothetical protein